MKMIAQKGGFILATYSIEDYVPYGWTTLKILTYPHKVKASSNRTVQVAFKTMDIVPKDLEKFVGQQLVLLDVHVKHVYMFKK